MTQIPLFQPFGSWRPPAVNTLPSWAGAKRVSVDVETNDPLLKKMGIGVRRGGYIVGISFAIEDGPRHYLPVRHQGGDNLDPRHVFAYMREVARTFTGEICGGNLSYDLDYLAEEKIVFREASWFRDCMIAEPLLDELQNSYALEAIAHRRGVPGKDEKALRDAAQAWGIDPKSELWKLPARYVGEYAEQDAALPLQLLRRQERQIEDEDLWDIYNLESRVLPVLVKMRRRGVLIDQQKLAYIEQWSEQQEAEQLAKVKAETGVTINVGDVNKSEQLAMPLRKIGVEVPKTAKTGKASIKNSLLEKVHHPVADALLRARKVNKLRTTFVASIRRYMTNGRIHPTFNQLRRTSDSFDDDDTGARYGRLSSVHVNIQQQPSRDDFAKLWRSIYLPEPGKIWVCADYSQQEPRMLTHYAYLTKCQGASVARQKYIEDPKADNHTMMARIIFNYPDNVEPPKGERSQAKIIYLGKCYNMGGAKLAHQLGLPTVWKRSPRDGKMREYAGPEAQAIIDQFDRQAPFVKQLARKCEEKASRVGYIRTIGGRKCRFPMNADGTFDWTSKALNRLIQGSSADQTKKAMVDADAAGHYVQLQVHDEVDGSVTDRDEAESLGDIMRNCLPISVPSRVDVEIGDNWGYIK